MVFPTKVVETGNDKDREAFCFPYFFGGSMKFKDFRLIYVSQDYLNFLHEIDSEIFFMNQKNYEKKPYLGILISENDRKYVIPLTSAKPRHAKLNDVTTTSYRIYEIIDITKNHYDENDILVDADVEWLKSKAIDPSDYFK